MRVLSVFFILFIALAASAQAEPLTLEKQNMGNVASLALGDIEIIAIEDSYAQMEIGLFSGPLSPAERERILPNGYAPASVNVFVLKTPGQTILVDSGYGSVTPQRGKMLELLNKTGIKPESIDMTLLTHLHFDHAAGLLAGSKASFPNANVLVSAQELKFWQNPDLKLTEGFLKNNAELVEKVEAAYENRISTFEFKDKVNPAITSVDARGHTAGHSAFLVESGNERLLIIGDLLHGAIIQFQYPDENTEYDMDQEASPRVRKELLNWAAEENLPIAGMHIPWPGIGYVKKNGQSGFIFTPLE